MDIGKYRVPRKLEDEDKFGKYFTKRRILILVGALVLGLLALSLFRNIGLLFLGIFLVVFFLAIGGAVAFFPIPKESFLTGGGNNIEVILWRLIIRRRKRCVYTRMNTCEPKKVNSKRRVL